MQRSCNGSPTAWCKSSVPSEAPTPCRSPGCAELVYDRRARGLCVRHVRERSAKQGARARRRNFTDDDRKRDNWYSSSDWRRLRRSFISRNPLCVDCFSRGFVRKADVVDHIVERKDDDSLRLDSSNLQSLCHSCHNTKSAEQRRARRTLDQQTPK